MSSSHLKHGDVSLGAPPLRRTALVCALAFAACLAPDRALHADSIPVTVLDPNLQVTTAVTGLTQPIGVVFLPRNDNVIDMLVLEKGTGQVKRVLNGVVPIASRPRPAS
jgi:hypothetical protein